MLQYIQAVLQNRPADWLKLTTHRLDIYDEEQAKTQFLDRFEQLYQTNNADAAVLRALPTAYDYIRLGHPLSCILEWALAKMNDLPSENVISFSSKTVPLLAILRKNLIEKKNTLVLYTGELPAHFDAEVIRKVYGYSFDCKQIKDTKEIAAFEGSTVFLSEKEGISKTELDPKFDFYLHLYAPLGSVLLVNGAQNESYISEIQHVRRRETIAMTPENCLLALQMLTNISVALPGRDDAANKAGVRQSLKDITGTALKPLVASSGLSMQYAIMMGLVHDALEQHPGKAIKFIVPPNCYGGTNDQARRVAACIEQVAVVDLLVDGDNDMVQSLDTVLTTIAQEDAIPYIIAEIPTNPRVEVPDLQGLQAVLMKQRQTANGQIAIDPVFILDQTFCPDVHFLGEGEILSTMRAIAYASGSKFPSGGLCTAGYCVGNQLTASLMEKIELHLQLCDNEATGQQMDILAKQLPSMKQRIVAAYHNTHDFVHFIHDALPEAKINFVSEELAAQGFTPSVFSLDLPAKGLTAAEKEAHKRALNLQLINLMITKIPDESKFCVSYGQLKGCYWTIPATSTQGTTKEGDKDYIVRVSVSPDLDLELHKKVFLEFAEGMKE